MLALLRNLFFSPPAPSVVLIVPWDRMVYFMHLVPEDGTVETLGHGPSSFSSPFRYHGTTEQGREQIGTIPISPGDSEGAFRFFHAVATRARKSWDSSSLPSSPAQLQTGNVETATQLAPDVLRRAALDAIRNQEGLSPSVNASATQTYPVFLVHVNRPRAGRITPESPISILGVRL